MAKKNVTVLVNATDARYNGTPIDALTDAYAALGKAYYGYRFEDPLPEYIEYFDTITRLIKEKDLQSQNTQRSMHLSKLESKESASLAGLETLEDSPKKERRFCPNCGTPYTPGEEFFCSNCGGKLRH